MCCLNTFFMNRKPEKAAQHNSHVIVDERHIMTLFIVKNITSICVALILSRVDVGSVLKYHKIIDYFQSAGEECFFFLFLLPLFTPWTRTFYGKNREFFIFSVWQQGFSAFFHVYLQRINANWTVGLILCSRIAWGLFYSFPSSCFWGYLADQDYAKFYSALVVT